MILYEKTIERTAKAKSKSEKIVGGEIVQVRGHLSKIVRIGTCTVKTIITLLLFKKKRLKKKVVSYGPVWAVSITVKLYCSIYSHIEVV